MVGLGVSEKQKDRARQVLERSADLSGFFESGKTKLVMPALGQGGGGAVRDIVREKGGTGGHGGEVKTGGGGGGTGAGTGGGGPNDPLIAALIQKLPSGGTWPADDRVNWLKMLVMGFQVAYGGDAEIEIKKKESAN